MLYISIKVGNPMIKKTNSRLMMVMTVIITFIFIFDFMTLIGNIYIYGSDKGYTPADLFLYIKIFFSFLSMILMISWIKFRRFNLSKFELSTVFIINFSLAIIYFLLLYLYKFTLLVDTLTIIQDKILGGNSSLAISFSRINNDTLEYVVGIYRGFNSEVFILLQIIALQFTVMKVKAFEYYDSPLKHYDAVLFKRLIFPTSAILLVTSFLLIPNIETYNDSLISALFICSLIPIFMIIPIIFAGSKIFFSKSILDQFNFKSLYYLMIVLISFSFISHIALWITMMASQYSLSISSPLLFIVSIGLEIYIFISCLKPIKYL